MKKPKQCPTTGVNSAMCRKAVAQWKRERKKAGLPLDHARAMDFRAARRALDELDEAQQRLGFVVAEIVDAVRGARP
jgi:hypothetical protein